MGVWNLIIIFENLVEIDDELYCVCCVVFFGGIICG